MKVKKVVRDVLCQMDVPTSAVGHTRNGHLKITVHGNVIFTSSTPSDHRGLKNLSAQLKRAKMSPMSATSKPVR